MDEVEIIAGPPPISAEVLRRRVCEYLQGTAVERAIVFGSFARGDADCASDLDLILIEPTTLPPLERGRAHLALFRLGIGLDLLVYTPEEYERLKAESDPLIERVEREGVVVYARPEG
jgi:predicted nucleotidyltransferase